MRLEPRFDEVGAEAGCVWQTLHRVPGRFEEQRALGLRGLGDLAPERTGLLERITVGCCGQPGQGVALGRPKPTEWRVRTRRAAASGCERPLEQIGTTKRGRRRDPPSATRSAADPHLTELGT